MTDFKYEDVAQKTLSPQTRKALAVRLKEDIDEACVTELTDEHRNHLGASVIGHDCQRFIWSSFRWLKFKIFEGRMLRLFQRGHFEEEKFIKWLRAIGCQVWEVDPSTGKQFKIWGVMGHYGGSTDAAGMLPYFPDLPMLMEFKTHNSKSFVSLVNKGVVLSKPRHFSQMCSYGKHFQFKYALYCAVNKNDDDFYLEVVELDWNRAHDLMNKAQDIILAKIPPEKISLNPAYFECKMCAYEGICFHGEPVEINCRSCKSAEAVENAEWFCNRWQKIIPKDAIKEGCGYHASIAI